MTLDPVDKGAAEKAFREASDGLLPWRIRVSALTCLAANGAFVLVDVLSLSGPALEIRTAWRVAFTPAYLILMWVANLEATRRHVYLMTTVLAALLAVELSLVGTPLPAAESVGFFPAMLFLGIFLPLPLFNTAMITLMFVAAFVGVHVLWGVTPTAMIIKHAGNLVAAAGVAVVAAFMAERLRRSERNALALASTAEETRRLSAAVLSGQDTERRRLARDLHDATGQTLVAALLHLDLALKAGQPAGSISTARSLVDQALEEIRAVARDLHPPTLAQFGLPETLRALGAATGGLSIVTEIAPSFPAELAPAVSIGLFRIAQAALANAMHHGHARQATMRLSAESGMISMEIQDDGTGFHPGQIRQGVGLMSMRERAVGLGGTLSIDSAPGKGTVVRVSVPAGASEAPLAQLAS